MVMPDFAWRGSSKTGRSVAEARAVAAWMRIQDKPTSVIIMRGAVDLDAQTVRIDASYAPRESEGGAGQSAKQRVTVLGVIDHPSEGDTDIQKGDRFVLNSTDEYTVIDTMVYPGEIQATAERTR